MVRIITDSVSFDDIMNYDQDIATFVMFMGRDRWHYGRHVDKGVDTIVLEKKIVKTKVQEPKRVILDQANLVKLGGPFEKIGEQDESVGGPNQKVGSDNKE